MSPPSSRVGSLGNLGHYRLVERVGGGGMGTVYRAVDQRTGAVVAIKMMHQQFEMDKSYLERFRREAYVASLLRSPYTVQVLEFAQEGGRHFLVSEFVDGAPLSETIQQGRLSPQFAAAIAIQVGLALVEAETRAIIHRDIKPGNILITSDGAAKVTDFGISRLTYTSNVTMPGLFVGTVAYSAPEQHRGQADTRSDIYSLGLVLFEMLAGESPFKADTPTGLMRLHEEAPPPLEKLAGVPQQLLDIVACCLEKDPGKRYKHPQDLVAALDAARAAMGADPAEATVIAGQAGVAETRVEAREAGEPVAAPMPETRVGGGSAGQELLADAGAAGTVVRPAAPPMADGGDGRRGNRRRLLIALGGFAGFVVALTVVLLLLARGGDDNQSSPAGGGGVAGGSSSNPSPQTSPSATAGAGRSPTASPSPNAATVFPVASLTAAPATPTATPVPQTPTPRPPTSTPAPPTPTPTPIFPKQVTTGGWDFNFRVTSNTCGAGDPVGTVVPYTYTLQEIGSNKGFINDGEVLRVIDQKGLILGMVTLHWPTITVSFVNEFQGFATLTMSFSSPDTGAGDLSILYSGCSIRYEDR